MWACHRPAPTDAGRRAKHGCLVSERWSSAGALAKPTSRKPSGRWRTRAANWRRPRSRRCRSRAEKSPSLRRTRLPSGPGLCHRRRDRVAGGADTDHAAGATRSVSTLCAEEERGQGGLELFGRGRGRVARPVGGAQEAMCEAILIATDYLRHIQRIKPICLADFAWICLNGLDGSEAATPFFQPALVMPGPRTAPARRHLCAGDRN